MEDLEIKLVAKYKKTVEQLKECEGKLKRARNPNRIAIYRVICIRLDERIKLLQEIIKEVGGQVD